MDARDVLCVENDPASEVPAVNWKITREKLAKFVEEHPLAVFASSSQGERGEGREDAPPGGILAITGFVARTSSGITTTLKRKGSDLTASIFAFILKASSIVLWSNFDGIYSADPVHVPGARLLADITYNEVLEYAFYCSDWVLHPSMLHPAMKAAIPITLRNAFNLTCPGTRIHEGDAPGAVNYGALAPEEAVKCLVERHRVTLVKIVGAPVTIGEATPLNDRNTLMMRLRNEKIRVSMLLHAAPENTLTLVVDETSAEATRKAVEETFAPEFGTRQILRVDVAGGFAILTAVGDAISQVAGVASVFFSALQRRRINVYAVAQNGERIISVVIRQEDADAAFRCVHSAFKEPVDTISIAVIGAANHPVASRLAALLARHQQRRDVDPGRPNFDLVAVSDMTSMVLRPSLTPATLATKDSLKSLLASGSALPHDAEALISHLEALAGYHRVIVDCCDGDREAAKLYPSWLSRGFHIVSANLAPFTADPELLASIRRAQQVSHAEFLFTEAALPGYPLAQEVAHLQAAGDHVVSLEGVVTPALNSLFTGHGMSGTDFASLVTKNSATLWRFFGGEYQARKLIALARVCGLPASSDMDIERLVSKEVSFRQETGISNPEKLKADGESIDRRLAAAKARNQVVRYVGLVDSQGNCTVQLRE